LKSKNILYKEEAKEKLLSGVKKITDAVKVTMGAKGRTVIIQDGENSGFVTKDGITVGNSIYLSDPVENLGVQLIKEASYNTNKTCGDGSSTTQVLAGKLFELGSKENNTPEFNKGIYDASEKAIELLRKISKPIETNEEIRQVAFISSNGDEKISSLIAQAMKEVGKDGAINFEANNIPDDDLEITTGYNFDRGILSPYFANNKEKLQAEYEKPLILVTSFNIQNMSQILKPLELAYQAKRTLIIIAGGVDGEALQNLVVNTVRGEVKSVAIKAPGFGKYRNEQLEDIAIYVGATYITSDTHKDLTEVKMEDFGSCEKIVATPDETTIIKGTYKEEELNTRVEQLKTLLETEKDDYEIKNLKTRIGKLNGGVALIKVGAKSETELKEKLDRVEDALNATKSAVEEGIVVGGGCALLKVSEKIKLKSKDEDYNKGVEIIKEVLKEPFRTIISNAGYEVDIQKALRGNKVFDVTKGKFVDGFKAGIIDPTKVEVSAIKNSVSVATTLLTTDAVISEEKEN
jgi:chaperonin GroEL